jgi:hypothetical protein
MSKGTDEHGVRKTSSRVRLIRPLIAAAIVCGGSSAAHAHGTEGRYMEVLDWKKDHIARTFGSNRAHLDGMINTSNPVQTQSIDDQRCVIGDLVLFDVEDTYAFDIDEPVNLEITYAAEYSSPFLIAYDMNGGTGQGLLPEVTPNPADKFGTVRVTLERARFAGQGTQGGDIAIGTRSGVAVCDIKVERSNTTTVPAELGTVKLTFQDSQTGGLVPARVGLYDATGRAPLASDQSLMLQRFADDLRMLSVNERTFWPSSNRQAFYVDGNYETRVPVGTYELVATRGLEFKAWRGKVEVKKDAVTASTVTFERYADLPAKGWWSGDAHIHVTRDEAADPTIWGFVAAEDVYVGNLLEMGNIATLHFKQPKEWGRASRFERDGHFLVSGQEDPRTGHFGHTIHHNLQSPIRPPTDEYFLYDKVFEESKRQGGLSGFAHMGWNEYRSSQTGQISAGGIQPGGQINRGLVLLAHTGLVNFIEVLQRGRFISEGWYRLLNLGYRINPAAGSDWPYSDFPGVVRNFTKLDGPLNLDAWFEAYKQGRTYVTNGPFLELTVNGKGMGEELRVKKGAKLEIVAQTQLNPDVDTLDRLELVVLGEVDAAQPAAGETASIKKTITAEHSLWIAARSYGSKQDPNNMVIAHSAPIYVVVDDEPTWSREALPGIIADMRGQLERMLTEPIDPVTGPEPWETRLLLTEQWVMQRPLLKPRVEAADAAYAKLLAEFSRITGAAATGGSSGGF